jgi:hypothetical protein
MCGTKEERRVAYTAASFTLYLNGYSCHLSREAYPTPLFTLRGWPSPFISLNLWGKVRMGGYTAQILPVAPSPYPSPAGGEGTHNRKISKDTCT